MRLALSSGGWVEVSLSWADVTVPSAKVERVHCSLRLAGMGISIVSNPPGTRCVYIDKTRAHLPFKMYFLCCSIVLHICMHGAFFK